MKTLFFCFWVVPIDGGTTDSPSLSFNIYNQHFFFTLKKGENDQVFGSIRVEDILNEVKKLGFQLEKKQLLDFVPLSSLGDNEVKIRLGENLLAQIKITITAK